MCPTRTSEGLDLELWHADHSLAHLIQTYRHNLKSLKPVGKQIDEAKQELQTCPDWFDWTVFEASTTNLDEVTHSVTSYIRLYRPNHSVHTTTINRGWRPELWRRPTGVEPEKRECSWTGSVVSRLASACGWQAGPCDSRVYDCCCVKSVHGKASFPEHGEVLRPSQATGHQ